MTGFLEGRAQTIYRDRCFDASLSADRLFGVLMPLQYLFAVLWTLVETPLTYDGSRASVHPHLMAALVLGGLIAGPVTWIVRRRPGAAGNRTIVAVGQMVMGALLIHITGGRIETHFHVFVSLAFLAFYRDVRVLAVATGVVVVDHVARGLYVPQSIYGIGYAAPYRILEHAFWVLFEDLILALSIRDGVREMQENAKAQAQVEETSRQFAYLVEAQKMALAQRETPATLMVEYAPDAIFGLQADGIIVSANAAAETMLGVPRDRLRERPFARYLAVIDGCPRETAWQRLAGGPWIRGDRGLWIEMLRADGATFLAEITLVVDGEESERLYTAFVRDLSIGGETVLPMAA